MVAKRHRLGGVSLEIGGLGGVDAPPPTPVHEPARSGLARPGAAMAAGARAVGVEGVVDLGAEVGGKRAGVGLQRLRRPVARRGGRFGEAAAARADRRSPPARSSCSSARSSSGLLLEFVLDERR